MNNPKEEAKRLVDRFMQYVPADESLEHDYAKQCALICVEEIFTGLLKSELAGDTDSDEKFWEQVKKEIEAL